MRIDGEKGRLQNKKTAQTKTQPVVLATQKRYFSRLLAALC